MAISKTAKNARKHFRKKYSTKTFEVLKQLSAGKSSQEIAKTLKMSVTSVGTTRGNYTRGVYAPWAYMDNHGSSKGVMEL